MAYEPPLEMSIGLNVLNHLGLQLYSNIPAVVSEIVANAWDADATVVDINVDRKTRNIQLSIKAKDAADQSEAMANLSQQSARENAGTTSLGALLRAKLDNN